MKSLFFSCVLLLYGVPLVLAAPRPVLRDPVTGQPQAHATYRALSYCQARSLRDPRDIKTFPRCQAAQCDDVLVGTTDARGRIEPIARPCNHAKYYVQKMVGALSDGYGRYFRVVDSRNEIPIVAWPYRILERQRGKKITRDQGCTDACGFTAYVMGPTPRTLYIEVLGGDATERCSSETNPPPARIKKHRRVACPVFPS